MPSSSPQPNIELLNPVTNTIESLVRKFETIPADRRTILTKIADFIEDKQKHNKQIQLVFICTHNSRRSHIAQIWAEAAASYYGIENVVTYSGGTEATAFNPRAVQAMEMAGFKIIKSSNSDNPIYTVSFSSNINEAVKAFSKKYDSEPNPKKDFAAIMTCSHADENCPVVVGMEKRISLPFDDPKDFDGTPQEAEKYLERVNEIGKEILYAFSIVNHEK